MVALARQCPALPKNHHRGPVVDVRLMLGKVCGQLASVELVRQAVGCALPANEIMHSGVSRCRCRVGLPLAIELEGGGLEWAVADHVSRLAAQEAPHICLGARASRLSLALRSERGNGSTGARDMVARTRAARGRRVGVGARRRAEGGTPAVVVAAVGLVAGALATRGARGATGRGSVR